MIATTIYPGRWRHEQLTHEQLESVVRGFALTQGTAQGILDRRVGLAAYRDEVTELDHGALGRWVWRLTLSPLGAQLRKIERQRRRLAKAA